MNTSCRQIITSSNVSRHNGYHNSAKMNWLRYSASKIFIPSKVFKQDWCLHLQNFIAQLLIQGLKQTTRWYQLRASYPDDHFSVELVNVKSMPVHLKHSTNVIFLRRESKSGNMEHGYQLLTRVKTENLTCINNHHH